MNHKTYNLKFTIVDMQMLAKDRGGFCLSKVYLGSQKKLQWHCSNGHTWFATSSSIKQGKWCPDCSGRKKLTMVEMNKIAESRGGVCLSDEYVNGATHLQWQCSKGHNWSARPYVIKRGSWCPICSGNKKLNIGVFQKIAESKGGTCLSTEYVNNSTPLTWMCSKEHIWSATPSAVKHKNWCRICAGKQRLTIDEMKNLALSKGGVCLSDNYKNVNQKLRWQCSEGHTWEATSNSIKSSHNWCPICSAGVSERITQKYFELIFNKPFLKTKPLWLKNERGNRMELDGYNKELNLAFEYQGAQHYTDMFFNKDHGLKRRMSDDQYKKKICKDNNVTLIEVPYTIKHDEIYVYITNQLTKYKIHIPDHKRKEVYELDVFSKHNLQELKEIAARNKGMCLSDFYVDGSTKLKWKCFEGHVWEAKPSSIRFGVWCSKCALKKRSDLMRGSLVEMCEFAKSKEGQCLTKVYTNSRIPLKWKCKNGHTFMLAGREVARGVWCSKCYGNKKLGIKEMQLLAKKRGGICLSTTYKNSKTKLAWQCREGHSWQQRQDVIRGGSWCPACANNTKRLPKSNN